MKDQILFLKYDVSEEEMEALSHLLDKIRCSN